MRFFQNRVPDETVDAFCAMRSELLNGMPFDDLDHGEIVVTPDTLARQLYRWIDESGSTWHCAVALEPDGSIAGMTDVAYMPLEPDRTYQFLTGTRMDCRGRGLAKWLKAAMLLFVRNTYPDVQRVITENASSNAGMLAINNRLGFKKHRGGSGYQIERSRLADLLQGAARPPVDSPFRCRALAPVRGSGGTCTTCMLSFPRRPWRAAVRRRAACRNCISICPSA